MNTTQHTQYNSTSDVLVELISIFIGVEKLFSIDFSHDHFLLCLQIAERMGIQPRKQQSLEDLDCHYQQQEQEEGCVVEQQKLLVYQYPSFSSNHNMEISDCTPYFNSVQPTKR